jgi:hypothetical protein
MDLNVDGVILFNERLPAEELAITYSAIVRAKNQGRNPDFKVGIRFSNCQPARSLELVPKDADILWVRTHNDKSVLEINRVERSFFRGLYFLSINATRYDPRAFVQLADVLFIESPVSGIAPQVAVIRRARQLVGDHPLGIANGMNPVNLERFADQVNWFIVQSSIVDEKGELNRHRVAHLLERLHHHVHA